MNKFHVTVKSNPSGWLIGFEARNDVITFETDETLDEIVTRLRLFGFGVNDNPLLWIMPAAILMVEKVK